MDFSVKIHSGLKHVIVLCGTGYGKTQDMEIARQLMKTAVNYRHDVFSATHKKELEAAIRDCKEFKYLFEDRERPRASQSSVRDEQAQEGAGEAGQTHLSTNSDGQQVQFAQVFGMNFMHMCQVQCLGMCMLVHQVCQSTWWF